MIITNHLLTNMFSNVLKKSNIQMRNSGGCHTEHAFASLPRLVMTKKKKRILSRDFFCFFIAAKVDINK